VNQYTVTVTGYSGCVSQSVSFVVDIVAIHPCALDTLSISTSVFLTTVQTYNLFNTAVDFTFTDTAAISANSYTICGNLIWTIKKQSDGLDIDSAVFTLDLVSATKKITTESSDEAKIGTHTMTATVKYADYTSVIGTRDFSIVVANPCASATIAFNTAVP
jgi:hypothetical protein